MKASRIPEFAERSFDGMLIWFAEMSQRDLLFHPDDSPRDMVWIKDGTPMFSDRECRKLNRIMREMFESFGDDVYKAAHPIFMKRMGIKLDS